MIPGPSSTSVGKKNRIVGGWAYALKSVEFIAKLNPSTNFEIVFGCAREFGDIPEFPYFKNINFHTYTVNLLSLGLVFPNNPSSQHGALLNFVLKRHKLNTVFYAILDPDCYLIQPNTFSQLSHYMMSNNVDVLGISYPSDLPRNYYWDFPTAYFQLINSISCQPNRLNFLPDESAYVKVKGQHRIAKILFKLSKFLKRLILEAYHRLFFQTIKHGGGITVFLRSLPSTLPYRGQPLKRDTGWVNRENLNNLRAEIIPYIVFVENLYTKFNSQEYLANNHDVKASGIDPAWHFLRYGVYENRTFGKQSFPHRLLISSLKKYRFDQSVYPATSLKAGISVFESILVPIDWGNLRSAFEYHWKEKPFCIHLGHKAKKHQNEDLYKLGILLVHLILEAENGGD